MFNLDSVKTIKIYKFTTEKTHTPFHILVEEEKVCEKKIIFSAEELKETANGHSELVEAKIRFVGSKMISAKEVGKLL